jgi:signal peptidase I
MKGMLERPTGFAELGGLSQPGPLRVIVALIVAGMVLVLGGGAYGPVAKLAGGRRARTRTEPAGAR